jgi:hypothetical protein
VDNENHEEHEDPAVQGTDSAPDALLIKDEVANEDGSKDL